MTPNTKGYGTEPQKTRRTVPVRWVAVGAAALAVGGVVALGASDPEPAAAPQPATTAAPATPAPTAAPTMAGHDHHGDLTPENLQAARDTLVLFMTGWQSTDPDVRAYLLERSATPELADSLASTRSSKVITARWINTEVAASSPYSVAFNVYFEGVPNPDQVHLVIPADSEHGWLVSETVRGAIR